MVHFFHDFQGNFQTVCFAVGERFAAPSPLLQKPYPMRGSLFLSILYLYSSGRRGF